MAEKITESLVSDLSAALRNEVSIDVKLQQLTTVKSGIKQHNVPESCIAQLFEALRIASLNPHTTVANAGFAALNHLLTRLSRQEPKLIAKADPRILSLVVDELGDQREKLRALAAQALTTIYGAASVEVERCVRNLAMAGKNPRAKESSMQWLLQMHQERGLQFRMYVPSFMELLEDADAGVRDVAKATVIELFRNAPNSAKSDLKKQLKTFKVRPAIEQAIIKELTSVLGSTALPSEASHDAPRPPSGLNLSASVSSFSSERPATPVAEGVAEVVDPMYVNTNRELDDIFRDMQVFFESRESEQNWLKREESVTKLRRLVAGNASTDFVDSLVGGLRAMLDGILKAVSSLRTSLSKEGCSLVQDMAVTLGPSIDPMVELMMQALIKLSAATKKISSQLANTTVDAIIAKATYSHRILQHIWNACQDKNVQPRSYAAGWLKTLLNREASNKSHVEHNGGLDMIDKCIKKGLNDANPGVREKMRSTYWFYAQHWPTRADTILASLDPNAQKLLNNDANNPNFVKSDGPARPGLGLSKSTLGHAKPSLREAIMPHKIALTTERRLPARPGSAMSHFSPSRNVSDSSTASTLPTAATPAAREARRRPESAIATVAGLSGAPMRPTRRRPDLVRPATAGPYSVRSHDQPSVEVQAVSPNQITPKPLDKSARRAKSGHIPQLSDPSIPVPTKVATAHAASPSQGPPPQKTSPQTTPMGTPTQTLARPSSNQATPTPSRQSPPPQKTSTQTTPMGTPTQTPARPSSNQTTPTPSRQSPFRTSPQKLRQTQSSSTVSSSLKALEDMTMVIPRMPSKVQIVLRDGKLLLSDDQFNDLVLGLFHSLQDSSAKHEPDKAQDIKAQKLATIKLLLSKDRERFQPLVSVGLESLILTRSSYESRAYLVSGLELVAEGLVELGEPLEMMRTMLRRLHDDICQHQMSIARPVAAVQTTEMWRRVSMGLHVLASILERGAGLPLAASEVGQIVALANRCLCSDDSGVRMETVQMCVAMHARIGPSLFWDAFSGIGDDSKSLMTYYIAKKQRGETGLKA